MARGYNGEEIVERCDEAGEDISNFYKQAFVNYRGKTLDTDKPYTEVVAEWCLRNLDRFVSMPTIRREASYNAHHDGTTAKADSTRNEERIAMALFRQSRDKGPLDHLGKIIDYQIPLKNKREDSAGKIDLLAYDGATLHLLELKDEDSPETMLRCVLEGYTYERTVDWNKLIVDFKNEFESAPTSFAANPLVFEHGAQHQEYLEERPQLHRLMQELECVPFLLSKTEAGAYAAKKA